MSLFGSTFPFSFLLLFLGSSLLFQFDLFLSLYCESSLLSFFCSPLSSSFSLPFSLLFLLVRLLRKIPFSFHFQLLFALLLGLLSFALFPDGFLSVLLLFARFFLVFFFELLFDFFRGQIQLLSQLVDLVSPLLLFPFLLLGLGVLVFLHELVQKTIGCVL